MSEMIRLDRYVSECGVSSRKQAVNIIKAGRVTVDGNNVSEPGLKIPVDSDVSIDGQHITYRKYSYYMLNKPAGCVSAVKDGISDTVISYLKGVNTKGLYPIGRLDKDTEGLLLITNDGDLCHKLISPSKHVEKTYYVIADKQLPEEAAAEFMAGLDIGDEAKCRPASLVECDHTDNGYAYELTITEGRFHQVKRMFMVYDSRVVYLKRIKEGGVILDPSLQPGEFRTINDEELKLLKGE